MAEPYGTFRICVLRTSHLEPYRTSVPYFSSIFEAYRTNVLYQNHYKKRRTVPPYCTFQQKLSRTVPYRTAILALNYSQLQLTLKSLAYKSAISIHALASVSAVFCLCIQKASPMCEKSGVFNWKSVPTNRTRTFTKKVHRTNAPYRGDRTITKKRTVPAYHSS